MRGILGTAAIPRGPVSEEVGREGDRPARPGGFVGDQDGGRVEQTGAGVHQGPGVAAADMVEERRESAVRVGRIPCGDGVGLRVESGLNPTGNKAVNQVFGVSGDFPFKDISLSTSLG